MSYFSGTTIKYAGLPKDSSIVWRAKEYSVTHFDYDTVKARAQRCIDEGDKKGLEVMTKNIKEVIKNNPGLFDDFLEIVE